MARSSSSADSYRPGSAVYPTGSKSSGLAHPDTIIRTWMLLVFLCIHYSDKSQIIVDLKEDLFFGLGVTQLTLSYQSKCVLPWILNIPKIMLLAPTAILE